MLLGLLAKTGGFQAPNLDYHALAPEMVLAGVICLVLAADLLVSEDNKVRVTQFAGFGLLASLVPIITLAASDNTQRSMFGGAYVVDHFALVLKGLFIATGYVVLLMSTNYVADGDYYEGEYSFLLLASIFGMVVMSSARDLITIFVALEMLSIPAYMLAGWRKRDLKSNEAALKYYLLGVLSSAVMLYGMSLVFGLSGTTVLADMGSILGQYGDKAIITVALLMIIIGFAFKVSAVPFHFWAPDTYEGAPTPVTAFLSVASKTAGFVALMEIVYVGFGANNNVWGPLMWVLAAITMTGGNLIALRQTNVVRMLAYSSVAQAGYILVPFAVAGGNGNALVTAQKATILYLLVYTAMNLGAFAVIIAVARKTRSGEISSFGGLFTYAPGLTLLMTAFMFSLAGIPPLGGWFAKLYMFSAALDNGSGWAVGLAVIAGLNSVIALFYYASIAREMWMRPVPDGDVTPISVPPALATALGICVALTVAVGVYPTLFAKLADLTVLTRGVF